MCVIYVKRIHKRGGGRGTSFGRNACAAITGCDGRDADTVFDVGEKGGGKGLRCGDAKVVRFNIPLTGGHNGLVGLEVLVHNMTGHLGGCYWSWYSCACSGGKGCTRGCQWWWNTQERREVVLEGIISFDRDEVVGEGSVGLHRRDLLRGGVDGIGRRGWHGASVGTRVTARVRR